MAKTTRKCLVKVPVWADQLYSGFADLDDPEDEPTYQRRKATVKPDSRKR